MRKKCFRTLIFWELLFTAAELSVEVKVLVPQSCLTLCDPMSMEFSSKNTGLGSHSLLQGIFLIQGSNLGLLNCRQIFYHLSHSAIELNLTCLQAQILYNLM